MLPAGVPVAAVGGRPAAAAGTGAARFVAGGGHVEALALRAGGEFFVRLERIGGAQQRVGVSEPTAAPVLALHFHAGVSSQ